jgi:PadR family transcriptional regulator PadR
LLLLLLDDPGHGYGLLDGLPQLGFVEEALDPSLVYRNLRDMERAGWVVSEWDTSGSGPPRRVYTVTSDGEAHLAEWMQDLQRMKEELDRLLRRYSKTLDVRPKAPRE